MESAQKHLEMAERFRDRAVLMAPTDLQEATLWADLADISVSAAQTIQTFRLPLHYGRPSTLTQEDMDLVQAD